jgi:hypothetical protein
MVRARQRPKRQSSHTPQCELSVAVHAAASLGFTPLHSTPVTCVAASARVPVARRIACLHQLLLPLQRRGGVECRCRAGCGDQPLPIPGALDFWSGVQAILLRPSSLWTRTRTWWWCGGLGSSLQEGKVRTGWCFGWRWVRRDRRQ